MLTDLLQEVAELKRTIEKNEKVLLKKSYWESHLSRKIEKLQEENKNLKEENKRLKEELNKLEDVKELFGKIVIDLTQLDKLKKIVYKKDANLED